MTVVGLARSGMGAANLLAELGARVVVTDIKDENDLRDLIPRLDTSVKLDLGSHTEDVFIGADVIVISPGVILDIPPIVKAKEKGIPVIGELELAYQVSMYGSTNPPIPPLLKVGFLSITGTNGKSTTTALLDFMMKKRGFSTILGGNIGNALTEEIFKSVKSQKSKVKSQEVIKTRFMMYDYIVSEVSSFQLESIKEFRPKGAAILNITPDHLDRYHSIGEYADAKARIFENQGEDDFLVLNRDDPETMKVASKKIKMKSKKPKIYYFSHREEVEGLYFKNGRIYCNLPSPVHAPLPDERQMERSKSLHLPPHSLLFDADEIKIKGVHNLENAMAASAMALLAGCPKEVVADSLKEFTGLEHRLEFVREIGGVIYFNDSKGTNVGAVAKSLESFSSPVILIAGGRDKAGDFSVLRALVRERVKALVLIGEAKEKIKKELGDLTETVTAKDLKEAVNISSNIASQGDVVLLSPACASFDMFADFEDRGRQFKKIIMEMADGKR